MKRRSFLRLAAAGGAAMAVGPGWLQRAFADVSVDKGPEPEELAALLEGLRRARAAGKPLLVVVVPRDNVARWDRGHAWGELLNHGSDEQLWPLSLFEVACATVAAARKVAEVPASAVRDGGTEPMVLVLEAHGRRGEPAIPAHVELPQHSSSRQIVVGPNAPKPEPEGVISTRRIAALGDALNNLALVDVGVEPLAARTRSHLSSTELAAAERALAAQVAPTKKLVDRAASLVAAAALTSGPRKPLLARLVADSVVPRLRAEPPTGSHWGSSGGCGVTWEPTPEEIRKEKEEEERERIAAEEAAKRGEMRTIHFKSISSVGCGMGHVPAKAHRFLGFFVKREEG